MQEVGINVSRVKVVLCLKLVNQWLIGLGWLILSLAGPVECVAMEPSAGVRVFLLSDTYISAIEAMERPVEELELASSPLFSASDIESYVWQSHVFTLTTQKTEELLALDFNDKITSGIPFVVLVGDERIYLGAFWSVYSSRMPPLPFVAIMPHELRLLAYRGEDVINDPRIKQSLEACGLVR